MYLKSTVKIITIFILAIVSFLSITYGMRVAKLIGMSVNPNSIAFVYHGIPFTIVGTTSPEALVTVRIPKLILSQPVIADEEGRFMITFNNVERGVYEMIISANKDGSSNEFSQLVGIPESDAVNQITLSEINIPLLPVDPIKKDRADLNNDGQVNFVDLSILLYWWGSTTMHRPYNVEADLNSDGVVNFKDVSLMLTRMTK